MSNVPTIFNGEMQLMNWGESSANGAWVKFWITPEDLEAFRHLKCKSGKIAGHRVAAVLVEIGDDERPVQRDTTAMGNNMAKGGALAVLAGRLCADERFWDFLLSEYGVTLHAGQAPNESAQWVREQCGVDSRAELDHNEAAAEAFHRIIRGPWQKYCQQRGWK
jgi:hypothetical protein